MKKQIISSISILSIMLLGCGGGGGSSAPLAIKGTAIKGTGYF